MLYGAEASPKFQDTEPERSDKIYNVIFQTRLI